MKKGENLALRMYRVVSFVCFLFIFTLYICFHVLGQRQNVPVSSQMLCIFKRRSKIHQSGQSSFNF